MAHRLRRSAISLLGLNLLHAAQCLGTRTSSSVRVCRTSSAGICWWSTAGVTNSRMFGGALMLINPKRQRFIEEYLVDCNATQAAIRAGYSEKTAEVQGSQLLSMLKVEIDARLAKNKEELAARSTITKERVVREIARLGLVDPGQFFDPHGNPIEVCQLPAGARRALAGFEFYEDFEGKGESRKAVGYRSEE